MGANNTRKMSEDDHFVSSLIVTAWLQSLTAAMPRITERDLRAAAPMGLILSSALDSLIASGYEPLKGTWEVEYIDEHPLKAFAAAKDFIKPTRGGAIEEISVWVQGIVTTDGLRIEAFEFQ